MPKDLKDITAICSIYIIIEKTNYLQTTVTTTRSKMALYKLKLLIISSCQEMARAYSTALRAHMGTI